MKTTDYFIPDKTIGSPNIENTILSILNDFDGAYAFHSCLKVYSPTPLISLSGLARELNIGSIWVKNEAVRFGVPAIKTLGASYAMNQLLKTQPEIVTFCSATDGNHGRAVAWSACQLRKKAVIFVPAYTAPSRIENIQAEGAIVKTVDGNYDKAVEAASKYAIDKHCKLIQDTAWKEYLRIPALITAGYFTQMREIEIQTKGIAGTVDLIIVQAGVGSWPSAIVHFASNHLRLKKAKIICVEPFESDCFLESAKQNTRTSTKKTQQTVMAGLNCGTPSLLAWELMKSNTDVFLSINDGYAIEAMRKYYFPVSGDTRIEAGESGAAGLAGLLALLKAPELEPVRKALNINQKTRILIFNTEGISDPELFRNKIDPNYSR